MVNDIIPLQWGKELRPSAVNTLDKINEVIHFINQSEIHEFTFSDSGSGESVQTANSTQLLDLTVYGKSVQDGTPTPENPVPVQVVGGKNLLETTFAGSATSSGVTATKNNDGSITLSGTASGVGTWMLAGANPFTDTILTLAPGTYTLSLGGAFSQSCTLTLFDWPNSKTIAAINGTDAKKTFTLTEAANVTYVRFQAYSGTYDHTIYPQLEAGNHATPYTPYGCIGLQIGETVTPIDLQGHTLAGLRNDVRDELDISGAGVKKIAQRVGVVDLGTLDWQIASTTYGRWSGILPSVVPPTTGGELLNGIAEKYVIVSSNAYNNVPGTMYIPPNGSSLQVCTGDASIIPSGMFYYQLETPQTIELGTITPPTILDGSTITINASLTPTIDVKWFTEDTLPEMMNAILGLIKSLHPDDFTTSTLDANIVHSIQPIDIQPISDIRPISDIQPIEDIEIMQDENESEE